jgi:protein transport protein SEC39
MDDARSSQETSRPGSADGQQRTRKRDMISNAVTGGLVSGMSWVLGAPAPRQQDQEF